LGKYKFGKPDQEIELEDFKQKLNDSRLPKRQKAYLVVLYWFGCRRSEPLVIQKEDIEQKEDRLFITISYRYADPQLEEERVKAHKQSDVKIPRIPYSREKHGQAGGPTELPLSYFGVDLIREVWLQTNKARKVFPFSDKTGYRAFKKLYPTKTPHWARYTRVTRLRKKLGSELSIDAVKSFTGIRRDSTIENYGLKTKADIHKIADMLE